MSGDNLKSRSTQRFCSHDILALFEFQHLSSNQTGQAGPARNTESQQKGTHTFSKEDRYDDNHNHVGNTGEDLQDTHHDIIHKTSHITADTTVENADQQGYEGSHHTDGQGNTAADPDTGEDISSQVIQTEDMLQGGTLVRKLNVLLIIGMRINIRCKDAHKHDDKKKNQARHGDFIFLESSECILPVGNAGAHQIL